MNPLTRKHDLWYTRVDETNQGRFVFAPSKPQAMLACKALLMRISRPVRLVNDGTPHKERFTVAHNTIDETGNRYGHLTVLRRQGTRRSYAAWLCQCACGNTTTVTGQHLRRGATKSCGCRQGRPDTPGHAALSILIGEYRHSAQKRKIPWKLTRTQVKRLTSQLCHYCGAPPSREVGRYHNCKGTYMCNGLDRTDSIKGYTIDNVVPCCKWCNYAKRERTISEFYAWVDQLHAHIHKGEHLCQ